MQFVVLINCSCSWLLSAFLAGKGPPLHLFMFTHAQKVSFYLTSYPLASPFSWPTIWPPPHPLVISLLSHPHLDPCFLITACPTPVPYKHSSRCGGKCKASEGKSQGWERAWSRQKPRQNSRLRQHQDTFVTTAKCSLLPAVSTTYSLLPIFYVRSDIQKSQIVVQTTFWSFQWEWQSGSAQICSYHGFLKTLVSEVLEVTYTPDYCSNLKVGVCLKICLTFRCCLFYFIMGF